MEKYKVYEYIFPNKMIYIGMTKDSIQERRNNGYNHNKRLQEASISVNGYKANISRVCGKGKPYKNYYWDFERR